MVVVLTSKLVKKIVKSQKTLKAIGLEELSFLIFDIRLATMKNC